MVSRFSNEAKVGLMIFIAGVLFIYGVISFKGYQITKKTYPLHIQLDNASGLGKGDPVTMAGLKVGKVTHFTLRGGHVIVAVQIDARARFPVDSEAYVKGMGLMGEKEISISPGKSNRLVMVGDTIAGSYEPNLMELSSAVEPMLYDISDILGRLKSLFDDKTEQEFRGSLSEVHRLTHALNRLVSNDLNDLDDLMKNMKAITANLSDLSGAQKKQIGNLIDNLEKSSAALQESSGDFRRISRALGNILESVEKGEGTLGRLMTDEDLYNRLKALIEDTDTLVRDFREHPQKYINVKVFDWGVGSQK